MCGIAGFLTAPGEQPDRALLTAMCDRIRHRGPDGDGYYLEAGVALGHRRLSIIDVEGGKQPMANEDGRLQVVFNGEIYNFPELRQGLVERGHAFTTHSDTEVLVHLYEEVGERLPEHLNGMFAFAIWDRRDRTLFLARDRFGEKPLYHTTIARGVPFAFASELKALAALPGLPREVCPEAAMDYLCFSHVPEPRSIYRGIAKLEAATSALVTQDGRVRLRRYWDPPLGERRERSYEEAVEELRALAAESVRMRMISDVPLGAFLSGGVDSSVVVAMMAEASPRNVRTFSIGFDSKAFNELEHARKVARRYQTEHTEHMVTPNIHDVLPKLVHHYDEPFADSSAVPMLYLAEMTRRDVTVALSGDGADEIFGGYRRYKFGVVEAQVRERLPEWFRRTVVRAGARFYPKFDYLPRMFRAKALLTQISEDLADGYFTAMTAFRDAGLEAVLSPSLRRAAPDYSPRDRWRARFRAVSHLHPLEQFQAVDLTTYLPGDILVKTDRAAMAHSLEGRAPWLDHRLAEFSFSLPPGFKLERGVGKRLFKSMAAPLIPHELITRPKMGFVAPVNEYLRSSLREEFESTALAPEMEQYFRLEEVRRLWREHQRGIANHSRKLWTLMMFASWDRHHRR